MSWTVAAVESELIRRFGGKMALVTMDVTTQNGTNASLRGPIRRALTSLGLTPAAPPAVSDADIAPVVGWQAELLLDSASLQLLTDILGNLSAFDVQVEMDAQKRGQLDASVRAAIAEYQDRLAKPYGPTTPATLSGAPCVARHIPHDPFRPRGWVHWRTFPYPR